MDLTKLKSRKLWVTTIAAAFVTFAAGLGIDVTPEQVEGVVYIVIAYVLGQGYADGKALEGVKPDTPLESAVVAAANGE